MDKSLRAIIITLGVSSIAGLIGDPWIGFTSSFGIALLTQFVIGSAVNRIAQSKYAVEYAKAQAVEAAEKAKQTLRLTCPCTDRFEQIVPIRFDTTSEYACTKCTKKICPNINVTTALITDIIDLDASQAAVIKKMTNNPHTIEQVADE